MASKGLDGSAFSFTTTRGHTTHISILWVFVLFTFFAVVFVSLAGFQEGLKERQFPDAKVNGNLEVTDATANKTGVVAPTSTVVTVPGGAAFSPLNLVANTIYHVTGTLNASACILPSGGSVGDTIVIKHVSTTVAQAITGNTVVVSFTCSGGEQLQTNSYAQNVGGIATNGGALLAQTTDFEVSAAGNTSFTITGATDGTPGTGTELLFTKVSSNRWFLRATLFGSGALTTSTLDTVAFG